MASITRLSLSRLLPATKNGLQRVEFGRASIEGHRILSEYQNGGHKSPIQLQRLFGTSCKVFGGNSKRIINELMKKDRANSDMNEVLRGSFLEDYDDEPMSFRGRKPRREMFEEDDHFNRRSKRDWNKTELPPVKSNCYNPADSVSQRSQEEIRAFREANAISSFSQGDVLDNPILSFEEAGFDGKLVAHLKESGFNAPMPIQSQSWPVALSGKNMVGIGQTGSGKTLGFLLPAMVHLGANKPQGDRSLKNKPLVLVLAPTRELAQQIDSVAQKLCRSMNRWSHVLYGGSSKMHQLRKIETRPVDVVIATPGRLLDLVQQGELDISHCSYVVLDEADRMLDMGFEPQLRKILPEVRPDRQLLMWSATWPKEIRQLARDFFGREHVGIKIGSAELAANKNITQIVDFCGSSRAKDEKLANLLEMVREDDEESGEKSKILIFTETKRTADLLERRLRNDLNIRSKAIHGGRTQSDREQALRDFRDGRTNILIATNVAARGLDVDDIKFVVNYEMPGNVEDYVHRIGRTGRRDRKGTAYSLLTVENRPIARDLAKVLKDAKQEVPEFLMSLVNARSRR